MGSYEPAFYTIGSLVLFAAFLPFILLCLKAADDNTGQGDLEIRVESSSDHQTTGNTAAAENNSVTTAQ